MWAETVSNRVPGDYEFQHSVSGVLVLLALHLHYYTVPLTLRQHYVDTFNLHCHLTPYSAVTLSLYRHMDGNKQEVIHMREGVNIMLEIKDCKICQPTTRISWQRSATVMHLSEILANFSVQMEYYQETCGVKRGGG